MKVLFVIRSLQRAGAERQLVTLTSGLQARGHNCAVATFYAGGELEAELLAAGVRLLPLGKQGRWDTIAFQRRLVKCVRSEAPDLLHTYLSGANLMAAQLKMLLGGIPLVWGLRASFVDMRAYDRFQRTAYRIEPLAARAADLVICNSQAGRAAAIAMGYPARRITTIENGIDTARFRPSETHRAAIRHSWCIGDGAPFFGIVGRLDPLKDHTSFLHAAALVRKQQPASRFLILGDGGREQRINLTDLAAKLGLTEALHWEPALGAMERIYPALDLRVSASTTEGFSNVIAEAMACGVPCAVTDVGDSALIVGDTGAVAPPSNPEALALAILSVLARRSPALSEAARARIVENYSVERMVLRTEAALADVIDRAKHRKGK